MENVLIINGHQKYDVMAEGKLTQTYIQSANNFFKENDFKVKHSTIESDYNINDELEKFKWADYILFQYPIYWMSLPWLTKKYIDEIFNAGYQKVTHQSDGRSRSDISKKYGSGGLMKEKKYMLSITYNSPLSEFDNKNGFFEGLSLDEANFSVHKVFQFCGVQQLKTYAVHDVLKGAVDMDSELEKFENILNSNFLR
ncbi:MAG: NAD(P)H-dependent oxidoreductase [Campylobacteraceae bacterium]|nr:NAD(P)H-dependent oxidoreductase [Campylobacteraceae bacterium]